MVLVVEVQDAHQSGQTMRQNPTLSMEHKTHLLLGQQLIFRMKIVTPSLQRPQRSLTLRSLNPLLPPVAKTRGTHYDLGSSHQIDFDQDLYARVEPLQEGRCVTELLIRQYCDTVLCVLPAAPHCPKILVYGHSCSPTSKLCLYAGYSCYCLCALYKPHCDLKVVVVGELRDILRQRTVNLFT